MMKSSNIEVSSRRKTWYSRLLFTVVLISVLYYIFDTVKDVSRYHYPIHWGYLVLSFIFTVLAYLMQLVIWIRLAEAFDLRASLLSSAKAWSLSQLGKYVPGKAGLFLVRFDVYAGASKRKIAVATGIEFMASMAAACILVLLAIIFLPHEIPQVIRWTAAISTTIFLIALYPPVFKMFTNWAFRLIKREPLRDAPTFGLLLGLVGANMLVALPYGLGLFFAFKCFYPISWQYFMTITSVYYAAALVGVAAIFAPAGIGVREGIVFLILPSLIPKTAVVFSTIVTRIIITVAEICLAVLFTVMGKKATNRSG